MNYLKWLNVIFFIATITYTLFPLDKKASPIDGYFKRSEVIITKGEDRIELNTNADFLAKEMKYTSIITITDVDKENQYSTFSIDGEMYLKNGLIVSKTNQVEDTDHINRKVVFTASTSPIVSQIQKSFLGIDVYKPRRYQYILIDNFFCYYDIEKLIARCME
ncbi:hypothetical protein [Vibrio parahaemolyticus]|uniref:Uncharacterized protein n=1 Tax=Vibrio parahaemolyticus TaxID=670 RepID=A0AAX0MIT6_VIBPH|nr:hypothetical protein [Vibrio parahaemolyticus]ASZ52298.1 hypothetical protein YA91_17960 [Vibrio parahaemolyticus]AUT87476.1 hypothetical protein RK51_012100 [Vibrio parahaemolyticus]EGF43710.1 hypothetical protein VP10329_19310 [Vibrio parahaemolyticus 10329]EGQ7711191.1 hypothetical protein [Vibrio parahaemolyticus]EGQ7773865.1 hypothetical protein [Vibrio parahaemolyticus]